MGIRGPIISSGAHSEFIKNCHIVLILINHSRSYIALVSRGSVAFSQPWQPIYFYRYNTENPFVVTGKAIICMCNSAPGNVALFA